MDLALLKPALEAGMAASLADINAIAGNSAKASFANTIEAMERAGEALDRAQTYYSIWELEHVLAGIPRHPEGDGAEACRSIRARSPRTRRCLRGSRLCMKTRRTSN